MTKNERLYTELAQKYGAETLEVRMPYQKKFIRGVYFDGVRPFKIKSNMDIPCTLNLYECRAADDDPCGPPVSIAPLNQSVMVNFAGTFVTAELIPKLIKERGIVEFSYDPFNID